MSAFVDDLRAEVIGAGHLIGLCYIPLTVSYRPEKK
jgi:hypothetical protein